MAESDKKVQIEREGWNGREGRRRVIMACDSFHSDSKNLSTPLLHFVTDASEVIQ